MTEKRAEENSDVVATVIQDQLAPPPEASSNIGYLKVTATKERAIWKYPLIEGRKQGRKHVIAMPRGAHILSLQRQGMSPTLWALVDPDAEKVERVFEIVGTGWTVDVSHLAYVGTWQDGGFVWHLFERSGEGRQ